MVIRKALNALLFSSIEQSNFNNRIMIFSLSFRVRIAILLSGQPKFQFHLLNPEHHCSSAYQAHWIWQGLYLQILLRSVFVEQRGRHAYHEQCEES